jgi:hypothetical protein
MHRASEFEWRGYRTPRRRLWPVVLVGTGLMIAYFFVHPDREAAPPSDIATAAQDLAHNEPSAIASAAPTSQPELAQNEASAIAGAPLRMEVINAPPKESSAQSAVPSSSPSGVDDRTAMAPNYASLRHELLRHLP